MHGDLTTRNILLNARRTKAKIGDLGLSKTLQAAIPEEANPGGTLAFAAPEVILNLRCSEKVQQPSVRPCAPPIFMHPKAPLPRKDLCRGLVPLVQSMRCCALHQ